MLTKLRVIWHVLRGHGVIHRADIALHEGRIDIWPRRSPGHVFMTEADVGGR